MEPADLADIGKTAEQIIEDLKEASGLIGKPLGNYECSYDPMDNSYVIFIDKEI